MTALWHMLYDDVAVITKITQNHDKPFTCGRARMDYSYEWMCSQCIDCQATRGRYQVHHAWLCDTNLLSNATWLLLPTSCLMFVLVKPGAAGYNLSDSLMQAVRKGMYVVNISGFTSPTLFSICCTIMILRSRQIYDQANYVTASRG